AGSRFACPRTPKAGRRREATEEARPRLFGVLTLHSSAQFLDANLGGGFRVDSAQRINDLLVYIRIGIFQQLLKSGPGRSGSIPKRPQRLRCHGANVSVAVPKVLAEQWDCRRVADAGQCPGRVRTNDV